MSVEKFTRQFLQADEEGRLETQDGSLASESGVEGLESRVCCGCSCLCDDISYQMRQGQVVRSLNLCQVGRKRLQDASAARQGADSGLTEGLLEDSLDKAAQILRTHGPVLFVGAEFLDEEAQQASVRLAKALGGIWVPWAFEAVRRFHQVACKMGWAAALLDDVRDHAEVVIFWRCDPLVTHHRHLSRYSFFARGRFTERGHHDRTLAAVGEKGCRIERLCKQFLDVPPDQDRALAESLRRGRAQEGFAHRDFDGIRKACEQGVYIAIFVDPEAVDPGTLETIFLWAAETNQAGGSRRVVILPLYRTGPNLEGFCQVSTAACGAPWGADFSEAAGRSIQRDWQELAAQGGCVFLLYPAGREESRPLPATIAGKPSIVLDPFSPSRADLLDVTIQVELGGLGAEGVFFRADGVPLRASGLPGLPRFGLKSAAEVLESLFTRIL